MYKTRSPHLPKKVEHSNPNIAMVEKTARSYETLPRNRERERPTEEGSEQERERERGTEGEGERERGNVLPQRSVLLCSQ